MKRRQRAPLVTNHESNAARAARDDRTLCVGGARRDAQIGADMTPRLPTEMNGENRDTKVPTLTDGGV